VIEAPIKAEAGGFLPDRRVFEAFQPLCHTLNPRAKFTRGNSSGKTADEPTVNYDRLGQQHDLNIRARLTASYGSRSIMSLE
jgi:hypothetical protein